MSNDKFQDVFPINIDFAKGEQPAAAKLTAEAKQIDNAFSKFGRVIGDPQDYFSHAGSNGAYLLSPEKLSIASLARIIGPSDYLSPRGASFQDTTETACTVSLSAYRNQWNLGFPLVKLNNPIGLSDSLESGLALLEWGVDITGTSSVLATLKTSLDEVVEDGDFHIDYFSGIITSYSVPTSSITITINAINMLGPGVPWATHNVIPTWKQTASLCYVSGTPDGSGTTLYTVTLPSVENASRDTVESNITIWDKVDDTRGATAAWNILASGQSAKYRLPYQLTNNLSSGDEIPVGYVLIYDNAQGRILTVTAIYYIDEHTLIVAAPDGWLTLGNSVRVICSGSSIAENIQWLQSAFRDNQHAGLSVGSKLDTSFFSVPLSHNILRNLYSDYIPSTISDKTKYYFRKSSFPTNPHPQYLHRSGYQVDDLDGNHANAMIGDITFAGISPDYDLGTSTDSGNMNATYGITWGGNVSTSTRLSYEGGYNADAWVSGVACRRGFNIDGTGAIPNISDANYGALAYTPWGGTPIYLRGLNLTTENAGAVLGFDYGRYGEMNYIKLMPAVRVGTYDVANIPVEYEQDDFSSPLKCTPAMSERLTALQLREFRFRGVSYNPFALNAHRSLGRLTSDFNITKSLAVTAKANNGFVVSRSVANASMFKIGTQITASGFSYDNDGSPYTIIALSQTSSSIAITVNGTFTPELTPPAGARISFSANEFDAYFTSPGVVGADFLNVYSNAIFFSDTGDGKATSFTTNGTNWMKTGTNWPTGLYYLPSGMDGGDTNSCFGFAMYNSSIEASNYPLSFGNAYGFRYISAAGGRIQMATADDGHFGFWQGGISYTKGITTINSVNSIYGVDAIHVKSPSGILLSTAVTTPTSPVPEISITPTQIDISISSTSSSYLSFTDSLIRMFSLSGSIEISSAETAVASGGNAYFSAYSALGGQLNLRRYDSDLTGSLTGDLLVQSRNGNDIYLQAVGGGDVLINYGQTGHIVLHSIKTTHKNPTEHTDGMIVINTYDNNIQIYADGDWREIASW